MKHHPSPRATILLGLASTFRGNSDITPINQGLNKLVQQSYCLCNRCVHVFDFLQLHLQPVYAATPTICTKQYEHLQDHPDLLDAMSPRTYKQLSLRHLTAPTFNAMETTLTLYSNCDSAPTYTFCV